MNRRSESSPGRWWEIRSDAQPDEDGYRELMADTHGRSRPERLLSVGADLVAEPRHSPRAFLWPVVSLVAAVGLILSIIYGVSTSKSTPPGTATSQQPAVRDGAHNVVGLTPDSAVTSFVPPAPLRNLPGADRGAPPPIGSQIGGPQVPAGTPSVPAATPGGPAGPPRGISDGATGNTGNQPTGSAAPSSPTPPTVPPVTVDGPAPAAPGPQQAGSPVSGTGGCSKGSSNSKYFECTITQAAPVYLAGTTKARGPMQPDRYAFLCQSDGSNYSIGRRANHWWAWVGDSKFGAWVPVVFLAGGPDDGREPGLPVCGSAPTTTAKPTTSKPTPSAKTNIVDRQTRRCLDSNDKGEAYTLDCNGGNYQNWYSPGDGTVRDKQTGRCLDSNDKGNVYTLDCNGGNYQNWYAPGDGTVRDKQTGRCLDSNEKGNSYTLGCNGGNYQNWDFR